MPDTAPRAFPDLPGAAVVALDCCLEDLSTAFENHYFAQLQRCYHRQPPDDDQLPLPLEPPF